VPCDVRALIATAVRTRVAGPDGAARAHDLLTADGPRWFADDRPIWRVHADASMFTGGLRALLLQSLHPLAMAGVAEHSDYRNDAWGRLQRTADFLAATTYGTADQAAAACSRVAQVHRFVRGVAPDGRPYEASDPHLLCWVHVCEVDSFLTAYQRYGSPLSRAECDAYVADMAVIARALGVPDPPTDHYSLRSRLNWYRPELAATPAAREAARFLLFPPMPLVARPAYGVLTAAAIALLPWWARIQLRLPILPVTETVVVRPAGAALTGVLRWALTPAEPIEVGAA
jgi:uncharacterized protein (DUF2236 family)